jgi:hypothetical protein
MAKQISFVAYDADHFRRNAGITTITRRLIKLKNGRGKADSHRGIYLWLGPSRAIKIIAPRGFAIGVSGTRKDSSSAYRADHLGGWTVRSGREFLGAGAGPGRGSERCNAYGRGVKKERQLAS